MSANHEVAAPLETRGKVLVVDDENGARSALVSLLSEDGFDVRDAPDGYKALGVLEAFRPDILLTDLRMPLMDGIQLLNKAREDYPDLVCIVMTAFGSVETAVEAMKAGADNYLTKPLNFEAVELILDRTMTRIEMSRELTHLRNSSQQSSRNIIGSSSAIQEVVRLGTQVANSRSTVLVTGESGTGKEMLARHIHKQSERAKSPFLTLHCAALPESLLESELFGHEKGSFTGATGMRQGRFEEADGGTLFLDEIGEISAATQVKLLRFLQTRQFERVGGNTTHTVDVRILAATNRNLEEEVRSGRFREDLYYRLNVINIEMPPLRVRRTDIPVPARHFIDKYARDNNKEIDFVAPEVIETLESHDWPGNVRELENVIERAVVLSSDNRIDASHLPSTLGSLGRLGSKFGADIVIPGSTLAEIERYTILETYADCGGNTNDTAEQLDISQRKVQYKLRDYRDEGFID
jgi:two-component system response regulator HydG